MRGESWQERLASIMPIELDGLRFRATNERDAELQRRIMKDPEIRRYVGKPIELSIDEAIDAVVKREDGMAGLYIIEDVAEARVIGECGFIYGRAISETETSIMLLPEFHSQGYGTRVLRALCDLWLHQLGHDAMHATVWRTNAAATKILVDAGFERVKEYVGCDKQPRYEYAIRSVDWCGRLGK